MHTLWFLLLAVISASYCYASRHLRGSHKSHELANCFSDQDLAESGEKVAQRFVGHRMDWNKYSSVKLVEQLENPEKRKRRKRNPQVSCPNYEVISKGIDISERSISPWTYRIDVDEDRFPQKLAFAKCLCNHCISTFTGKETSSLNSAAVNQSMLVLRKETCPHNRNMYTFRIEYLNVPVACTCVVPLY
ncbi:interleukin-17C [Rana temporaria]|uniref:interleukin-17C n=1 Tax=Rana temporaria TaxID=8407 RepID=UPI001AACAF3B|nr:interleukin-17C [Rana temporaria]